MDYMTYYRNPEAFALFRTYSTHLRKEREKKQASRRPSKRTRRGHDETFPQVPVQPRDSLLNYRKPELVARLLSARTECAQLKHQAQTERAELEQRYMTLLQEHLQCGLKIARLEAQVAEYLAFMERFRTALRQEEHGTQ